MTLGEAAVGTQVYLRVQGVYTPFRIMHHGKPDDSYDDSYSGGTILMLDKAAQPYQIPILEATDGVRDNYDTSWMHRWLNERFFGWLDGKVQEQVKEVRLPWRCDTGEGSVAVATGSQGLPAKVWLPSMAEASRLARYTMGYAPNYVEEGAKFDYWKDKAVEDYEAWEVTGADGLDAGWCLRTPNHYVAGAYAEYFFKVLGVGDAVISVENLAYVRPCLVLPDGLRLDGDRYIQAGLSLPVMVDGVWREGTPFVKADGVWREAVSVSVKVDGVWRQ